MNCTAIVPVRALFKLLLGMIGLSITYLSSATAQSISAQRITTAAQTGSSIRLVETLRIGSLDGEYDAFGRITDVTIDRRGRLFVVDAANHRVSVFNSLGKFERTIGRRGNGPGEFQAPMRIAIDVTDSVFVWDAEHARISVFDPDFVYRRSFRVPPPWMINTLRILDDGRLAVAAYALGEQRTLHLLDRTGNRKGSMGLEIHRSDLHGFEGSLLGGTFDLTEQHLVYSGKSPYQTLIYNAKTLRLVRHCVGDAEWTSRPEAVVMRDEGGVRMRWDRYKHVSRVIAINNDLFLNVIHEATPNKRTIDLLSGDCRLLRRVSLHDSLVLAGASNGRLIGVQTTNYPEIILYELKSVP